MESQPQNPAFRNNPERVHLACLRIRSLELALPLSYWRFQYTTLLPISFINDTCISRVEDSVDPDQLASPNLSAMQ